MMSHTWCLVTQMVELVQFRKQPFDALSWSTAQCQRRQVLKKYHFSVSLPKFIKRNESNKQSKNTLQLLEHLQVLDLCLVSLSFFIAQSNS